MDAVAHSIKPHRFTVADYHRMAEAGIFDEDSRVELIRGQIIDMAAIGAPHLGIVNRLNRLLIPLLAGRATLSVQNPVRLDDGSEPVPDFAVLRLRADDYVTVTPSAPDTLLLIEVSDTTIKFDRAVKAPLYAETGIPEFWIVNISEAVIEVYRRPQGDAYAEIDRAVRGRTLPIPALPGVTIAVADIFPGS